MQAMAATDASNCRDQERRLIILFSSQLAGFDHIPRGVPNTISALAPDCCVLARVAENIMPLRIAWIGPNRSVFIS